MNSPAKAPWQYDALVLPVEQRRCRCGATYTIPNPSPLLRKEQPHFASRPRRTEKCDPASDALHYNIRREIITIHTTCVACPACFVLNEPDGQTELWPRQPPPLPRLIEDDDEPAAPPALTLDDF